MRNIIAAYLRQCEALFKGCYYAAFFITFDL